MEIYSLRSIRILRQTRELSRLDFGKFVPRLLIELWSWLVVIAGGFFCLFIYPGYHVCVTEGGILVSFCSVLTPDTLFRYV